MQLDGSRNVQAAIAPPALATSVPDRSEGSGDAGDEVGAAALLGTFFRELAIDLQGVELRFESLALLPPHSPAAAPAPRQPEPVIDLSLALRVRQFPPLNLGF
jgi:hypothetical protein